MNILCIGPTKQSCHVGENLYKSFAKLKHNVIFCDKDKIKRSGRFDDIFNAVIAKKIPFPLSRIIEVFGKSYDFIFIDEGYFVWHNDVSIPVIYYQREFYRPPKCYYPTIALFFHSAIIKHFWSFCRFWMNQVPIIKTFPVAADFETYKGREKIFKGVSGIGFRESMKNIDEMIELTKLSAHSILENRFQQFRETGLQLFDTPISNQRYRTLLSQCEATYIPISPFQYTTRRIVEAMASKCACVIKLDGDRHARILRELGYEKWIHYVPIETVRQCIDAHRNFRKNQKMLYQMIGVAYDVTKKRHSYDVRAKYLIGLIEGLAR